MAYKDPHDPRNAAAKRKYYQLNKEAHLSRNAARRSACKIKLIELKEKDPCTDCGNRYPYYVMQYDHVENNKESIVGTFLSNGNLEKMLAEIAKCELVCANCHAVRTWTRNQNRRALEESNPR